MEYGDHNASAAHSDVLRVREEALSRLAQKTIRGGAMQASGDPRPARPMSGIGDAADRILTLNAKLGEVLERFHGPGPEEVTAGEISINYTSQIARLHSNIDTLNNLVCALAEVA